MSQALFDDDDFRTMTEQVEPIALIFQQAGDPWHDWGLCELHEAFQIVSSNDARVHVGEPDVSGFTVTANMTSDEFVAAFYSEMSANRRWNDVYPRFEEGKKIEGCAPKSVDGRRVPDSGDKNDPKFVKQNWESSGCVGNPPSLGRNKCQRISNVPLTPKVLENLLNPEGAEKSLHAIIADAFEGNESDLKQETNPLTANHHSNGKVRGPYASNSARIEKALFVLSCYATSLSPWKPFVTSPPSDCTVYLPDNVPFDRALRLWKHLHNTALRHPDEVGGTMYRNLPLSGDGEAAQLLMLLDSLQSTLPAKRSADDLDEDDIVELNNWLTISFSSGTGVNVGGVHRIEVPGAVFQLLAPIEPPDRWKNRAPVSFARDCLNGLRISDATPQNNFARALLLPSNTDKWRAFEKAAFFLCKNTDRANTTNRRNAALLPHFMTHFCKETNLMQEDQLSACRKIGELAGQTFNRDVTMISRLHNASSPDELRANLALLSFRLFKASNDDRDGLYHISPQEFQRVLDMTHGPDWAKAAQTISLFACLKAFNKNIDKGDNASANAGGTN